MCTMCECVASSKVQGRAIVWAWQKGISARWEVDGTGTMGLAKDHDACLQRVIAGAGSECHFLPLLCDAPPLPKTLLHFEAKRQFPTTRPLGFMIQYIGLSP